MAEVAEQSTWPHTGLLHEHKTTVPMQRRARGRSHAARRRLGAAARSRALHDQRARATVCCSEAGEGTVAPCVQASRCCCARARSAASARRASARSAASAAFARATSPAWRSAAAAYASCRFAGPQAASACCTRSAGVGPLMPGVKSRCVAPQHRPGTHRLPPRCSFTVIHPCSRCRLEAQTQKCNQVPSRNRRPAGLRDGAPAPWSTPAASAGAGPAASATPPPRAARS